MYQNSTEEGKRIGTYFCKVKEGEREVKEEEREVKEEEREVGEEKK